MKDIKILCKYIGGALALYFTWFLVYDSYLQRTGQPDLWLTYQTAAVAAAGLDLLGYPTEVQNTSYISYLHIKGNNIVGVGHACNALVLFAIFAGFILIFTGKVIHKLWYIALGIVLVFLANVLRVMSLGWIYVHWPAALDFNHKYTFTFLVYGFIFCLWMLWVKKFSTQKNKHAPSCTPEKSAKAA